MHMGFLFSQAFWGIFLIIIGCTLVLKVLFHIDIPLMRIFLAVLLVYLGISIIAGGGFGFKRPHNTVLFEDSQVNPTGSFDKYNVVFGRGEFDLSGISIANGTVTAEVNTVFGTALLKLDSQLPVKVIVNSAFAEARVPDGNSVVFGNQTYTSSTFKPDQNYLLITVNVVFGSLEIVNK